MIDYKETVNYKVDIVDTVIKYLYNVRKDEIFCKVYGESHDESYMLEKMQLMNNLSQFWGELDNERRDNLVRASFDYYENRRK